VRVRQGMRMLQLDPARVALSHRRLLTRRLRSHAAVALAQSRGRVRGRTVQPTRASGANAR
jgi:hypothetical protein